jgi:hypothetical protein
VALTIKFSSVDLKAVMYFFPLQNNDQKSFYAVFDGHAGMEAASYAAAHVPYHFVKSESFPPLFCKGKKSIRNDIIISGFVWFMVFNATFNNISVILWR